MNLGTGIFLSALLLAVVFLFHTTKDRWNWRKIFKFTFVWPLVVVIGLSAIGGGGYYVYGKYQDRARVQTGIWDLELGMSKTDVLFAKGEPAKTSVPEDSEDAWYDLYMTYSARADDLYYLFFIDDTVVQITYAGGTYYSPLVNGIEVGDSVEEMKEHLGEPSKTTEYSEGKGRRYSYARYRSLYLAEKGKIVHVTVYTPRN